MVAHRQTLVDVGGPSLFLSLEYNLHCILAWVSFSSKIQVDMQWPELLLTAFRGGGLWVVIRVRWAYEDGAPQMVYNKRTDLCHSEMPCTTFTLYYL